MPFLLEAFFFFFYFINIIVLPSFVPVFLPSFSVAFSQPPLHFTDPVSPASLLSASLRWPWWLLCGPSLSQPAAVPLDFSAKRIWMSTFPFKPRIPHFPPTILPSIPTHPHPSMEDILSPRQSEGLLALSLQHIHTQSSSFMIRSSWWTHTILVHPLLCWVYTYQISLSLQGCPPSSFPR